MIGGVEGVGDAAEVVHRASCRVRIADHPPLECIRRTDIAIGGRRSPVGVPGVIADGDHEGCGGQVAFMVGEVEREGLAALPIQLAPHPLEVLQAARGEVVTGSGLDVDLMERGEVSDVTAGHLDTGLLGLSYVSSPQLVEPGEHVTE